jgi:hypothetical protein
MRREQHPTTLKIQMMSSLRSQTKSNHGDHSTDQPRASIEHSSTDGSKFGFNGTSADRFARHQRGVK